MAVLDMPLLQITNESSQISPSLIKHPLYPYSAMGTLPSPQPNKDQHFFRLMPGVNFINVLQAAFMHADPESAE